MVQIHPPTRKAMLQESMGRSLGEGLSSFVNNYFAGKALDDVLNKEDYGNAPMSERTSRLERAMRPYGEYGENTLKNRIGIEQQVQQEQEQQRNQKKASVFAKALGDQPLTEKEKRMLSSEEHLAIAKHKQALEIQKLKNDKPSKPTQSVFEKERDKQRAKKLLELEENFTAAQGRESLYNTLDDLSQKLSGVSGYGKAFTEDAAQLESLGLTAIAPALKIFNPVGAIPVQKIELVKSKFAPKFNELASTQRGKIKALRFINQQAVQMGQQLNALRQKYGDDIPMEELNNLQSQGSQFIDMLDNYDIKQIAKFGEQEQEKEPEKNERPGFVQMKDPQGIMRWVPEEEAKKIEKAKQMQGAK